MRHLLFAITASLLVASQLQASNIFTTVNGVPPGPVAGTQAYGGSLGLDFVVGPAPIKVTGLGVWDSLQNGLFSSGAAFNAYIYNTVTELPVLVELNYTNADGINSSGYRFRPQSIILPAGFQGTVVAEGYWSGELNGNANTGGPGMAFPNTGVTYVGNRFGGYAAFPVNGDSGFYASGNFTYTTVPEASSLLVMLGVGAVGLFLNRKRLAG